MNFERYPAKNESSSLPHPLTALSGEVGKLRVLPETVDTVVLLSGGLDSTVVLAELLNHGRSVLALTFNYGQRALNRELEATRTITKHYEVSHEIISLPWLADLLPPAMKPIAALDSPETPVTEKNLFDTSRVWVPNRNGIFLNIAAAFAEATKATTIAFGANADEAIGFPDNTQAYRNCVTESLAYSTLNQVRVETPVGHLTKAQIIETAIVLDVPLHLIWSCYEGEASHCGACPSCLLLKRAFARAEESPAVAFASA